MEGEDGGREERRDRSLLTTVSLAIYSFNNIRVYKPCLYTSYKSRLNFRFIEEMMVCLRMVGEQKKRKKMVGGTKEREEK